MVLLQSAYWPNPQRLAWSARGQQRMASWTKVSATFSERFAEKTPAHLPGEDPETGASSSLTPQEASASPAGCPGEDSISQCRAKVKTFTEL